MPSHDDFSSLLAEFPPVDIEHWRARVAEGGATRQSLATSLVDGPVVHALCTAADGKPGPRPPARSPGWRIALEYRDGDAPSLIRALREDVGRGLESAWVRMHEEIKAGATSSQARGGVVFTSELLPAIVATLPDQVAIHLDAGMEAPSMVRTLAQRKAAVDDAVVFDPIAVLLATGGLGVELDEAYALLASTAALALGQRPSLRTVAIDVVPVHDAGASAEQEVAFALATGIEHLRRLESHGMAPALTFNQMVFSIACGGDLLVEISKLRALQRLWARVRAHGGAEPGSVTPLWVRTSWRSSSQLDPWVNLLRGTVGAVAAILGGADAVAVQPLTEALGPPTHQARRWAINTQHILRGESHLAMVDDPAAGSWAIESVTDQLAKGAWELAQRWLNEGGVAALVQRGVIQAEIAERAAARAHALATGHDKSTGTNLYPRLDQRRPTLGDNPAGPSGVKRSPAVSVLAVRRRRLSEPFEALRHRTDAWAKVHGARPHALLVTVGDARLARGVVEFARNMVTVGGFESSVVDGAEAVGPTPVEPSTLAVICGPAKTLDEHGPGHIRRLLDAGVRRVLVAGRPTPILREAGAHDFIHRGRDGLAVLMGLQSDLLGPSTESVR